MPELYDVAVIGAGPAGSYTAARLAEQGCRVIVFERRNTVAEKVCCTGIVGRECLEKFGLPQQTISCEASSATFYSPAGKALRVQKHSTQAYVVDRAALDEALVCRARGNGAEYLLSTKVCDIHLDKRHVLLKVEQNGQAADFESRMTIISSGFGGPLCEKLGLGRVGDFVLGAQAEVETSATEVEVYLGQAVAPGFFAWLVPTGAGKGLAGLLTRRKPRMFLVDFLSMLENKGKIRLPARNFAYGGIPLSPLPKTYTGRVLVIGDAAGQVKPTTGGGIYYGLIAAEHAASTVEAALEKGDFSSRKLAGYEKKWKHDLESEIRIGQVARKMYEKLTDEQLEDIFNLVVSNNVHEDILGSSGFSFDWHGSSILMALKHRKLRKILWNLTISIIL